jgi:hypothetical protein
MEARVDKEKPSVYFDDGRIWCETRYDGINCRHDAVKQNLGESKSAVAETKIMSERAILIIQAGSG